MINNKKWGFKSNFEVLFKKNEVMEKQVINYDAFEQKGYRTISYCEFIKNSLFRLRKIEGLPFLGIYSRRNHRLNLSIKNNKNRKNT